MVANNGDSMPQIIASSLKRLYIVHRIPPPDLQLCLSVTRFTVAPGLYSSIALSSLFVKLKIMAFLLLERRQI